MQKTEKMDRHSSLKNQRMIKGKVIHLDSDINILKKCKDLFEQLVPEMEYLIYSDEKEFNEAVEASKHDETLKCLIFDLVGKNPGKAELEDGDAKFLNDIESNFSRVNIPIFIYSGSIHLVENKFNSNGTVFKVDKDADYKASVIDKIQLFHTSGFMEVFSPGGLLEKELHKDLHEAFTKQFNNSTQIHDIIKIIMESSTAGNSTERVQKVFKRIAIRSLLSSLLAPEADEHGKILPEFVNPVEHYLQRISPFPFWTGDIFKSKKGEECLLIITPRCNVASKGSDELLVCTILLNAFPSKATSRDEKDKVNYALTDKPEMSGYDRYLPPSPLFEGGKVSLSDYRMISKEELSENFHKIITLSDELTNEILGKFGAYFFRTGITPWSKDETIAQVAKKAGSKAAEDGKK